MSGGFEDKLNAILNDQQAMGQIMALAQSLSAPEQQEQPQAQEDYVPVSQDQVPVQLPDVAGLLGGMDPKIMQMGMRLLQEYNRGDDRSAALLQALRPFVKKERFAKVDRAVQIARLSRVVRVLFDAMKEHGGGGDV
ncbi:MAG: hypothetical protein J6A62_03670 [Oscillospiraceae bacterium]|nr:hypothetical protein [Oscillospiraceae bacterium]